MKDFEQIKTLVQAGYPCITINTFEEDHALELIRQVAMDLNIDLWIWSVAKGVTDGLILEGPTIKDTENPAVGLANMLKTTTPAICVTLDLAEHLKKDLNLRVLRDLIHNFESCPNSLIMIDSGDNLPSVIKSHAAPCDISLPDEDELLEIVRSTLKENHKKKPIEIGISRLGLKAVVRNLRGLTRRQARQIITDTVADDRRFDDNDINNVLAGKRRMIHSDGLLEYIQTPLTLDEIGGMKSLKEWLKMRKQVFCGQIKKPGLDVPRGVLMLGVQGAGKSLCAKAVATAWQLPLLRMDPSTLYNSYIGESEKNLRRALKQTELMSPVILWIDEIEKAFASAASQSSDGGLSRRMFGTLLTWMQDHQESVFLIATANDIQALPPELLRKGRFDEIFFVDLPKKPVRKKIFEIHLKKRQCDPAAFDLDSLAEKSNGFSGSEIEQAVLSALYKSCSDDTDLDTSTILSVLRTSPPLSVTMAESIMQLRAWAQDRCVPAD